MNKKIIWMVVFLICVSFVSAVEINDVQYQELMNDLKISSDGLSLQSILDGKAVSLNVLHTGYLVLARNDEKIQVDGGACDYGDNINVLETTFTYRTWCGMGTTKNLHPKQDFDKVMNKEVDDHSRVFVKYCGTESNWITKKCEDFEWCPGLKENNPRRECKTRTCEGEFNLKNVDGPNGPIRDRDSINSPGYGGKSLDPKSQVCILSFANTESVGGEYGGEGEGKAMRDGTYCCYGSHIQKPKVIARSSSACYFVRTNYPNIFSRSEFAFDSKPCDVCSSSNGLFARFNNGDICCANNQPCGSHVNLCRVGSPVSSPCDCDGDGTNEALIDDFCCADENGIVRKSIKPCMTLSGPSAESAIPSAQGPDSQQPVVNANVYIKLNQYWYDPGVDVVDGADRLLSGDKYKKYDGLIKNEESKVYEFAGGQRSAQAETGDIVTAYKTLQRFHFYQDYKSALADMSTWG